MSIQIKARHGLASLVLLLGWGLAAQPQQLASAIPGIDEMPAATYPDADPRANQPERIQPSDDQEGESAPGGNEDSPLRTRLPLITNLKVEEYADIPHSVRISWDVSEENQTPIYVGRLVRPINTRDLVLEADNLTAPPLGPQETSFIDRAVPDGAYYYVVVTTYEMSDPSFLLLEAGKNYTKEPFIVFREGRAVEETTDLTGEHRYQVGELVAINAQDSVKLSWAPVNIEGVTYNVYKSSETILNRNSLRVARRIGTARASEPFIEDPEPVENRTTYYAVTVTDAEGKEHIYLQRGVSTVSNIFERQEVPINDARRLPSGLQVLRESSNAIKVVWSRPEVRPRDYRIYRSNRPIASERLLGRSEFVGWVDGNDNEFQDTRLEAGVYYYALIPRDADGKELRVLQEGRTFSGFGISVAGVTETTGDNNEATGDTDNVEGSEQAQDNQNGERPEAREFTARVRDRDVYLEWRVRNESAVDELHYLVYRSTTPIRSLVQIRERGELLAELRSSEDQYIDRDVEPGKYYYALVLDADGDLIDDLRVGRNYLDDPAHVEGNREETADAQDNNEQTNDERPQRNPYTLDGLNRILARTYHRRAFGSAIREVAPFVHTAGVQPSVRARALLYTGLSYYELGQHRTAMEYFVDDAVRRHYPERSRFWYSRSLERIR